MERCEYDRKKHFPIKGNSNIVYCGQCGSILKDANEQASRDVIRLCMEEYMIAKEEVMQIINDEDGEFDN